MSIGFRFNVEAVGIRLRKMTDAELVRWGKAARYMCTPEANRGQSPREEFVIQLKEAISGVATAEE
jgi:hypothetical protein